MTPPWSLLQGDVINSPKEQSSRYRLGGQRQLVPACPLWMTLAALLLLQASRWSVDRNLLPSLQPDRERLGYFDQMLELGMHLATAANSCSMIKALG